MDKQTLLDICKPFTRVEVNGKHFYLRRLSPQQITALANKYFANDTDDRPVDTNATPEEQAKLPASLRAKLENIQEWFLDTLTCSLCNEQGEPLFTIEERETVRLFDPEYLDPLKEKAHEFSHGYYQRQAENAAKIEAKKKTLRKRRS